MHICPQISVYPKVVLDLTISVKLELTTEKHNHMLSLQIITHNIITTKRSPSSDQVSPQHQGKYQDILFHSTHDL